MEQQRIDLERQRLELERRRVAAEEERADAVVPALVESPAASVLLIFGGRNHKVFLGCLCDDAEEDSVFNEHGKYGQYGLNLDNSSLWSVVGGYRGVVGDYTACGMFTKDPPIVVTPQGQAICRLTTDATNQYQCKAGKLIDWLKHGPCGQP